MLVKSPLGALSGLIWDYFVCTCFSGLSNLVLEFVPISYDKGTDQPAQIRRLVCAFVVRKPLKTGFLALRLISHHIFISKQRNRVDPDQAALRAYSRKKYLGGGGGGGGGKTATDISIYLSMGGWCGKISIYIGHWCPTK